MFTKRRSRLLKVTVVLVSAVASTALAQPAPASTGGGSGSMDEFASDSTYRDASGVVHYAFDPAEMPGGTIETQYGAPIDPAGIGAAAAGCHFADSGAGEPTGGTFKFMREVRFDPGTCTRQLAVASYPVDSVPSTLAPEMDDPSTEVGAESDLTSSNPAASVTNPAASLVTGSASYYGRIRVNVEDPPQIDVTSTRSRLWWPRTSCVTTADHESWWRWYSSSGWERRTKGIGHNVGNCEARTQTYGKYRNGRFCASVDTYTEHWATIFEGYRFGGWRWSYEVDKWGGCNWLLHYEYSVTTP